MQISELPPIPRMRPMTVHEVTKIQADQFESEHLVHLAVEGFAIAHTDGERAIAGYKPLEDCELHRWLCEGDGAPASPGLYVAMKIGNDWRLTLIQGAEAYRGVTTADIERALTWLDAKQDSDAACSHHGVSTTAGEFSLGVAPRRGHKQGTVLVFKVLPKAREWLNPDAPPGWRNMANGIDPKATAALRSLVEAVAPVVTSWNGISLQCDTVSFHVDRDAGPSLARCLSNYVPFARQKQVVGIPGSPDKGAA